MSFYRKIIDSDLLNNIIDLPAQLKNKQIEMILLPITDNTPLSKNNKGARGMLEKYKDVSLLKQEGTAWGDAIEEKYENR